MCGDVHRHYCEDPADAFGDTNGIDPESNQQSITSGTLVIGFPHFGQVT